MREGWKSVQCMKGDGKDGKVCKDRKHTRQGKQETKGVQGAAKSKHVRGRESMSKRESTRE